MGTADVFKSSHRGHGDTEGLPNGDGESTERDGDTEGLPNGDGEDAEGAFGGGKSTEGGAMSNEQFNEELGMVGVVGETENETVERWSIG